MGNSVGLAFVCPAYQTAKSARACVCVCLCVRLPSCVLAVSALLLLDICLLSIPAADPRWLSCFEGRDATSQHSVLLIEKSSFCRCMRAHNLCPATLKPSDTPHAFATCVRDCACHCAIKIYICINRSLWFGLSYCTMHSTGFVNSLHPPTAHAQYFGLMWRHFRPYFTA